LTGLPVPRRLVRQVPPQRRKVASEAVTGLGGEQALDFYAAFGRKTIEMAAGDTGSKGGR
jgi:hypothetical protein